MVRVARLELAASWSQTRRPTNWATPGYSVEDFAVVVKYVVKKILPHFQETFKSGDWGKLGRNRGVCNISGSRTGLVLRLPNQAPYQLGHTRILSYEKKLVVVKYVVKEILPHFRGTFKSGDWGKLGRNRGVRNISDSRTGLVLQLPNQARYQLRYTRI